MINRILNMFSIIGVLSNKDIIRLLGKEIFIYPFRDENLKGVTYNLTASKFACVEKDGKYELITNKDGNIEIPAKKRAFIATDESIYVSQKICGTYYPRLSFISKGLIVQSSTLDPNYIGVSIISVYNESEKNIIIRPGEDIASLEFSKLYTKADDLHDNPVSRCDMFNFDIEIFNDEVWKEVEEDNNIEEKKKEILNELFNWNKMSWRKNKTCLIKIVKQERFKRNADRNILIILSFSGILILIFTVPTIIKENFYLNNIALLRGIAEKINSILTNLQPIGDFVAIITLITTGSIFYYKKEHKD